MKKSRLIEILRTCTKKELRDLKKWVQSPAHNLREDVIWLYDYLLEDDHLWKDEFVAKAIAYARVYPNEPYDDAKMRQVMHFLIKTMEDFLIYQEVSQDEVESRMVLSKVLRKKRIDKLFEKNLKYIKEVQERQPYRNDQFFRNQYLRLQEEYVFLSTQTRTGPMNLQEVSNAHDVNYIIDKLRHSCYMLSHQKVYKADYDYGLIQQVIDYVDNNVHLLDTPAIAVYYYGYKTTTERDNEENFLSLKNEIFNNGHFFPHEELLTLYLMAINYCIGQTNAGLNQYRRESFELYKEGFEKKVLIQDGQISRFAFQNAITLGLYVKEYEWVENYIHQFKTYLDEKYRNDFVLSGLAKLHYERKEYDAAMKICSQTDFEDILMNLTSRTIMMKIYFEQNETDALDSYLESFRNYVVRKKVLGYHKSNYKNIISLTKKLFKVNPYNKKDKDKLRKEIEVLNPLTEREWLLEQLHQLG
jgi:hypothetical protein